MDDSLTRESHRNHTNGSSRARKKPKPPKTVGLWGEVEATLGLHGVRRIKPRKRTLFFSIVWCLILALGLGLFCYALYQRLSLYFSFSTTWSVQLVDSEDWPALTLCNLNPVRVTQLAANYWSQTGTEETPFRNQFTWQSFLDERPYINSQEFFLQNSHKAEDMIIKCAADSSSCSSANFSLTLTADGLCYKIKPDRRTDSLTLILNTESYEYISGLADSPGGVKVYVHDRQEVPITGYDTHVHISAGQHWDLGLGTEVSQYLDQPYGWCSHVDSRNCLSSCHVEKVRASCECRAFWFPPDTLGDKADCDIKKHFTCVKETLAQQESSCLCPTSCEQSKYTVQLSHYPQVQVPLENIMDPGLIEETSQRYQKAQTIQRALSKVQRDKDGAVLRSFLSLYARAVSALEETERELHRVKTETQHNYTDLRPRLHFHTNVALRGIQTTIERGYSIPWRRIEEVELHRITSTYQEVISRFNAIVARYRFTTAIEPNRSLLVYTLTDVQLNVNKDLTVETLESIATLYYTFVDTKPGEEFEVTPDKRYDQSLIPYDILVYNRELQQVLFSGLSNNLGLYIDDILKLQEVLKAAMVTRQYNVTAHSDAKANFIQHSREIGETARTFREQFVTRAERAVIERIDHMNGLTRTLESHIDSYEQDAVSMVNALSSVHLEIFHTLKHTEHSSHSFLYHSNVSRTALVRMFNADDVQTLMHEIDTKLFDLRICKRALKQSALQLQKSMILTWQTMSSEELLRSFYLKLYNDVMSMINNPKQRTYFMNIFTDKKMLNMSTTNNNNNMTAEALKKFVILLNADLYSEDFNTKLELANQTFVKMSSTLTEIDSVIKLLRQLQTALLGTHDHLQEFETQGELGDQFAKENLLSVTVTKQIGGDVTWTQQPAYTLQVLFVELGSLLAFLLGASVLTVLEFCDILLAWLADRFFSEGKKATREIPPEYRDKIKSRESLGSSRDGVDLNNSLNSQRRSYVTFRDFNNVNGSEV